MKILETYYLDQPFEVSIETQTVCNADCTFCPYNSLERKGEKMPDELINRLIDEMAEFKKPFYFSPFKVSDPLLDKRLYTILKRFNEKAPLGRIRIFTNGSALTLKQAEQLNDIDNLELWISFNEHRANEYKNLMNLDYQRTVKNIDQLHELDFRHEVKVLRVGVDREFREFCEKRWPDYKTVMIKKDAWLGFTSPDFDDIPQTACSRWWELSIMSNGIVSMCCMDSDGKYSIGDVNNQTLMEVYNSPHWRSRRESLQRDKYQPCSECAY